MEGISRLRTREATSATRSLGWVGMAAVLRGVIAPWYVRYFGNPLSPTQPTATQIVSSSVICIVIFLLATLASRYKPVTACTVAMLGFAGVCWVDFQQTPNLFEAGIVGKGVMLSLLVWSMMNAVFSRVL